jgi:hypothetical protein
MSINLIEYKKMSIFAMSLPLLKAPKGWKRARYIYIKGVTERFGFDGRRISQIQTVSQKQSNGNVSWDVYIQPSLDICLLWQYSSGSVLYTHRRGAFSVARFD